MDGVAIALQAAEEAEGEDAHEQTHQRQQDAHPRDDVQQQIVHGVCRLRRERKRDYSGDELCSVHCDATKSGDVRRQQSNCIKTLICFKSIGLTLQRQVSMSPL